MRKVPKYSQTTDGQQFGLSTTRWDERHRRSRLVLPDPTNCWNYESLIDIVSPVPGLGETRFLGMTADSWLDQLKRTSPSDFDRAIVWFKSRVTEVHIDLDKRPRRPDNYYCVPLSETAKAA